ncbi:AraC-type DNA-binding protein [Filimonas lacunae]|uniref:AraC-type DNA-binding protein n=2 Tax=Filimonas lacunae TaxID=477680 RepID=A0A1N7QYM8_9BACT|nr:AraC-type DNA-binding protein [Filimonas lacunae]
MVSLRCKLIVKAELENLHIHFSELGLGEVLIQEELSARQMIELSTNLSKSGLELLEDRKGILIERIKNVIIEMIHYSEEPPVNNFSAYLSNKLHYDYNYLSTLFSEMEGVTIGNFMMAHKIERVKELLIYNEMSLTMIAAKLHYSSVAHLSNQFKKVTGVTPSCFKNRKHKRLIALEDL